MSTKDEQATTGATAAAPAQELTEVDEDSQGNSYLPGVKPLVNARLKQLGDDVKHRRDAMVTARNEYVEARDELIDEMRKLEIPVYTLDTGETVTLTDKFNVQIKKPKSNLAGVTEDELPGGKDELDVD